MNLEPKSPFTGKLRGQLRHMHGQLGEPSFTSMPRAETGCLELRFGFGV